MNLCLLAEPGGLDRDWSAKERCTSCLVDHIHSPNLDVLDRYLGSFAVALIVCKWAFRSTLSPASVKQLGSQNDNPQYGLDLLLTTCFLIAYAPYLALPIWEESV